MIVDSRSLQTLIHMKERKEEISDIKFSPGEHLAVFETFLNDYLLRYF